MVKTSPLLIFLIISAAVVSATLITDSVDSITGNAAFSFVSDTAQSTSGTTTVATEDVGGGWIRNNLLGTEVNTVLRQELIDKGVSSTQAEALTTRGIGVTHDIGEVQGLAEVVSDTVESCKIIGQQEVQYNANINSWEYLSCKGYCEAADRNLWKLTAVTPTSTCPTGLKFTSFFPRAATTALTDYGPLRIGVNVHFCCNKALQS